MGNAIVILMIQLKETTNHFTSTSFLLQVDNIQHRKSQSLLLTMTISAAEQLPLTLRILAD